MSNNLADLIEYLELYKVLLESKYYTPSKEDEANELMEAIENAKKKAEEKGRLSEDDCKSLRRKVSFFFHPDKFSEQLPKGFSIDSLQLIQKFNAAMDEVEKEAKNPPKARPFQVNQATQYQQEYDDFTKNDYFYSDQRFERRPMSRELERERRREERQEQIDTFVDGVKKRIVRTSEFVATVAKERFDAIFRAIPSNANDYENIKRRFEQTLSNLSNRENLLYTTLFMLKINKSDLEDKFKQETTVEAINGYYNELLNAKFNKVQTLGSAMNQFGQYYQSILKKYAPEYNRFLQEWSRGSSAVFSDIVDANQELHDRTLYDPDKKEARQLKGRIIRLSKERDEYPTIEEARRNAIDKLKEMYPEYRNAVERYYSTKNAYDEARKEYDYVIQNADKIRDEEFYRRQDAYLKKKKVLDSRINSTENKHKKVLGSISDTKVRYGQFLDNYEKIYDRNYSGELMAHSVR